MLEHRVVQDCCPELFEGSVKEVVEVSDYFVQSGLILLVVHEWWVKSLGGQEGNVLSFIHVRLVHELLFSDHYLLLGKLFLFNNPMFALATHQLTIIKDLNKSRNIGLRT
jgi:hypothetical protein